MSTESPEYVQTSLASAITLGFEPGRFTRDVRLRCLNLLLTYERGCSARCSYCGLSSDRLAEEEIDPTFIRVKWPTYRVDDLIERLNRGGHPIERACVSMVTHPRALEDSVTVLEKLHRGTNLLLSALITPTVIKGPAELERLRAAGADRITVAVDAATEELFAQHRLNRGLFSWEHYWRTLADAVAVMGRGNAGTHLIVGLGETEEQMIGAIQRMHDLGVRTHLFSFFPEGGSRLQRHPQPPIGQYRRVQVARWIIDEELGRAEAMRFNAAGQVTAFGLDIEPILAQGAAFETSGCPGHTCRVACNRPFGNERPSKPFRNFPLALEPADIELVRSQLWEGLA